MAESKIKLIDLTTKDLLKYLEEKLIRFELTDSSTSKFKMIECCLFANHIPEWIWNEMPEDRQKEFISRIRGNEKKHKKDVENFTAHCRNENEFYNIVKDICNTSKHVRLTYEPKTQLAKSMLNIDPKIQYRTQTGKELEQDAAGNYLSDVPIDLSLTEILVTYKNSEGQPKTLRFWEIVKECIKYLHTLSEQYLKE